MRALSLVEQQLLLLPLLLLLLAIYPVAAIRGLAPGLAVFIPRTPPYAICHLHRDLGLLLRLLSPLRFSTSRSSIK